MKRLSFKIDDQSVLFSQPVMIDVGQRVRLEFESAAKKKFVFIFALNDEDTEDSEAGSVTLVLSQSKNNPDLYRIRAEIPVPSVDSEVQANGQSGSPVTFEVGGLSFSFAFRLMGYRSHWMLFPTITYKKEKHDNESRKKATE